jgi:tyrosyl-tRNA synthetase
MGGGRRAPAHGCPLTVDRLRAEHPARIIRRALRAGSALETLMRLIEDLRERGLVYQITDDRLDDVLDRRPTTVYCGFDPTDSSLHVGNLVPILGLVRFQRAGHRPIALVGGGTGMIGDPSGKTAERQLLTPERLAENLAGIRAQLGRFIDLDRGLMLNNADWLARFSLIEFLRDVGKHFSVSQMLAKESVKARLESGISFTEFAYMLLQSYDFLHLFREHGCTVQIGGQDQWGNITAGSDLVRRLAGQQVYGLTFPLITSASGKKFGKTEAGTVWLDPQRTSPYRLFQYFVNTADEDVVRYLKYFTLLPLEEIAVYERKVSESPQSREAQRRLAAEVTAMVHGPDAARQADQASQVLFGGAIEDLSDALIEEVFEGVPRGSVRRVDLAAGVNVVDMLVAAGAAKSKGEARRLIAGGGAYVNNGRVTDADLNLTPNHLASEHFIVLRSGRKNYYLVRVE